jgi:hypothetical protein
MASSEASAAPAGPQPMTPTVLMFVLIMLESDLVNASKRAISAVFHAPSQCKIRDM